MSEIIRRSVIPENITITGERAGTAERNAAIRHVETQLRQGRLDGDEAGHRVAFIERSVTKAEISTVLTDLPPLPGHRINWVSPAVYAPFLITIMCVFVTSGVIGDLLIEAEPHPGIGVCLLGVPLLVAGITGGVASFVTLACKLAAE